MYEPEAVAEEYHGQGSAVRDLYGKEGDNKEVYKASGSAAGSDITRTIHLFKNLDSGDSRKAPEGKVKLEEVSTQNSQGSGKDEEVSLYHYKGPHEGICSGRIAKGQRVCITHDTMC